MPLHLRCTVSVRSQRARLTLPSSGRAKGRFAPFGPPLMSNVRSPQCECTPGRTPLRASVHQFNSTGGREQCQQDSVAHSSAGSPRHTAKSGVRGPGPPVRWRSAHRRCYTLHCDSRRPPLFAQRSAGSVVRLSVLSYLAVFGVRARAVGFPSCSPEAACTR